MNGQLDFFAAMGITESDLDFVVNDILQEFEEWEEDRLSQDEEEAKKMGCLPMPELSLLEFAEKHVFGSPNGWYGLEFSDRRCGIDYNFQGARIHRSGTYVKEFVPKARIVAKLKERI